jgi:hypothetical protein
MDTSTNDTVAINNLITGSTVIMDGTFFTGTTNNVSESITFSSSENDNFLVDSTDIAAMFSGTNIYDDSNYPITDDILGNSRGGANTDSYDAGAHHSLEFNRIIDPGSGSGYDYTSLANWEANEQTDLGILGVYKIAVATCRSTDGTNDTTATLITGWTAGNGQYIKIWTDPTEGYRHPGYWVAGNYYRLVVSNASAIDCREAAIHIQGLMIWVDSVNSTDQCGILLDPYITEGTFDIVRVDRNVIRGAGGSIGATQWHFGVQMFAFAAAVTGSVDIFNNVIYDFGRGENYSNGGIEYYQDGANPMGVDCYAYNNTIVSCSKGLEATGTGIAAYLTVKNNLLYGGHRGYNLQSAATFGTESAYNVWDTTPAGVGAFGVQWASGRNTSVVADKLVDSGSDFSNIPIGSLIEDVTDGNFTYVVAIDSPTQLDIANDYFTGNEEYIIYTNMRATAVFQDFSSDNYLLGDADLAARDKGTDLSADAYLSFTDDIIGTIRPQNLLWDVGANEFIVPVSDKVTFFSSGRVGTTPIKMYDSSLGGTNIVIQ